MEGQTAYLLGDRKREFLLKIERKGFVYNSGRSEIESYRVSETIGILISAQRYVFLIMPKNLRNERHEVINEREILKSIADHF